MVGSERKPIADSRFDFGSVVCAQCLGVVFSLRFVAVCVEGETSETFSLTRDILSF